MAYGKIQSIRGTIGVGRFVRQQRGPLSLPQQQQLEGELMTDRGKTIRFQAFIEGTANGPAVKKLVLEPPDDDSLTSHDLRAVSLKDILVEAARATAFESTETEAAITHTPLGDGKAHLAGTLGHLKKGRRWLTREFLVEVAEIYNTADSQGLFPAKAVAEAYEVSRNTVKHWLKRAREENLIPPRGRGRPAGRVE